ncbi:MAG: sigma-70 family RNA polymerase sigma factor [Pirellula sp.]|nr:sigma-70 family RNA polymerase sigma factor [Pirellula sp.]
MNERVVYLLSTTQWTLVFRAAREEQASQRPALGQLFDRYWQPLYFYARRQGLSAADAEDATQGFLTQLLDGGFLASADPAKGRFRSYLLTHWKRYLIDRYRADQRIKRGGDHNVTSLYCAEGEKAWLIWSSNAQGEFDPDRAYYEEWASTIIRTSIEQLRNEYEASHRGATLDALLPHLTKPTVAQTYQELSDQLQISVGAAKVALHRLRQRFAHTVRALVRETLEDPADLEEEIQVLTRFLQRMDPSPSA